MKKYLFLIIMFLLMLVSPSIIYADSSEEAILVKFNSEKNIEEVSGRYNIKKENISEISELNIFKVKKTNWYQKLQIKYDEYVTRDIEYAEPDYEYNALIVPNDTYYDEQWALPKISAPSGWDSTQGDEGVVIAIIDTGINGLHEDLFGKVTAGYDFINDESIPADSDSDDHYHGTAVASVASALSNNNKGISGVSWNSKLMPVKALDEDGRGYASEISLAIKYAADNGAKVLNLSFGGERQSSVIDEAIDYAYSAGCFIAAASGNDNSTVDEPARNSQVFAVGATSDNDERWYNSNFGPELDAVAPGEGIITAIDEIPGSKYAYVTGTSVAAPHVSGLAALLLALNPDFTNNEIENFIKKNSDKVAGMGGSNYTNYYGFGRINIYRALNYFQSEWVSQSEYPEIIEGQSSDLTLNLKNIGSTIWTKDIVHLGTSHPSDRVPVFKRGPGWISSNRVEMQEDEIAPGETATFIFNMEANFNQNIGIYREYFQPVADGIAWMNDQGIYWDIMVKKAYESSWVSQNSYPTLANGESYEFQLSLKNNGNTNWTKNVVRLGTSRPEDRIPLFQTDSSWFSDNRIEMQEDSVSPELNATFVFNYTVPNNFPAGTYREYFRPVADGITWMNDQGIYWGVNIIPPSIAFQSNWDSQSPYPEVTKGEKFELYVKFVNSGLSTWKKGKINLGTSRPSDRVPVFERGSGWIKDNRVELVEDEAAPGEIGTFRFEFIVSEEIESGTYREFFCPVADGIKWFYDWGVYFDITVNNE